LGAALTAAVSAFFFFFSYRSRDAYFLFVFLIPFMPPYLGFGAGTEGFAISLVRILLLILLMSLAFLMIQNREEITGRLSSVYQPNAAMIKLLWLFFAVKVFSLSINSREVSQYIMLFMDFLSFIFIMILTMLIINSEEKINRMMKIIFYGYSLVLILVVIEYILQHPVYGHLASQQIKLLTDTTEGLMRGGKYRVSASFLNAIVLTQYLVMLLPIIVAYLYKNNYSLVWKIIYLLWFLFAIYASGSRSAIVLSVLMVYLYFIFNVYKMGKVFRFVTALFNIAASGVIFYAVYNYINTLIENFHGRFDLVGDEQTISSTVRALQYIRVYKKMGEAPFFGFGRARNQTEILGSNIDNYYFWMTMEVGIIGFLIFLSFVYVVIKSAMKLYKMPEANDYTLPVLMTIIIILSSMVLLQSPDNHIYLYIFAGLISAMKVLATNKRQMAPTPLRQK
jgi:hypothetical protein